ncbi:putative endonuclease lcl3 [Gaertneriomyces sp. JEL0708]|nr:putative endonuclease lcl3 [Gaertneriomyces sp. JEL0708]
MTVNKDNSDADSTFSVFAVTLGVCGIGATCWLLHPRSWRVFKTADYFTPVHMKRRIWGTCTNVRDNDNFRFFHQPPLHRLLRRTVPASAKELKDRTIHVRLAGIDAPEGAHFGMKEQPFHKESKEWLSALILGRQVQVKPLKRDQYGRLVSMVWVKSWLPPFRRNVSLEMLRAGYAVVYEQAGAEYDGQYEKFVAAEKRARGQKKGMWTLGDFITPAQHKKAHLRGN